MATSRKNDLADLSKPKQESGFRILPDCSEHPVTDIDEIPVDLLTNQKGHVVIDYVRYNIW
jgi:hypothetical protein